MKKLIIFIAISFITFGMSSEEIQNKVNKLNNYTMNMNKEYINIGLGINTFHIQTNDNYSFNNDNKLFMIEYERNRNIIGLTNFTNSFGKESIAVYIGQKLDNDFKGFYGVYRIGLCKGYERTEYLKSNNPKYSYYEFRNYNVFYDDYSIIAILGAGYRYKNIEAEINLIGNAVVSGIKIKI